MASDGERARVGAQGVPTGRRRPGLRFAPLRERFRGRGPGVLCFVLARAPHWSRLEGRRKDYDGQTADPTGLRVASAFANADAWQPSCGDRVCWHLHHAEAASPSTFTALRHTPDGGGTTRRDERWAARRDVPTDRPGTSCGHRRPSRS